MSVTERQVTDWNGFTPDYIRQNEESLAGDWAPGDWAAHWEEVWGEDDE